MPNQGNVVGNGGGDWRYATHSFVCKHNNRAVQRYAMGGRAGTPNVLRYAMGGGAGNPTFSVTEFLDGPKSNSLSFLNDVPYLLLGSACFNAETLIFKSS